MVRQQIDLINEKIARVCRQTGQDPAGVVLVGVTKFADIDKVREAVACGLHHVGENKVQEAEKKFQALSSLQPPVTRHMIGHLQTNKVKTALKIFDLIQSVDSVKLAEAINREAEKMSRPVEILVQVNTAAEEQKYGFFSGEAPRALEKISAFSYLRIKGLMTIGPLTAEEKVVRQCFSDLRRLRDQARQKFRGHPRLEMKYLSMGMTNDYLWAIEEGSNMVRIGRAIFAE